MQLPVFIKELGFRAVFITALLTGCANMTPGELKTQPPDVEVTVLNPMRKVASCALDHFDEELCIYPMGIKQCPLQSLKQESEQDARIFGHYPNFPYLVTFSEAANNTTQVSVFISRVMAFPTWVSEKIEDSLGKCGQIKDLKRKGYTP